MTIRTRDLGLLPYRQAWAEQERVHALVAAGESGPEILTVEHPPVITFGRRAELSASHLVASSEYLAQMGVEVVESDRGGDITFHGPGQLVAYPIIRLADFELSVGAYVRRLQEAAIACLARFGVVGRTDPDAIGVWVKGPRGVSKVCAVGVRVKGGVTLHGVALNVTTDLRYFELIVPCGLAGRPVTSLGELLGERSPPMEKVSSALAEELVRAIGRDAAPEQTRPD
jgi:lipoyl(octanoyl) transferase